MEKWKKLTKFESKKAPTQTTEISDLTKNFPLKK